MLFFKIPLTTPLLLSINLFIFSSMVTTSSSASSSHNATIQSGDPRSPLRDGMKMTIDENEDYDNLNDPVTSAPTKPDTLSHTPPPRCNYDLCRDQQESCQQIAISTGCSCPGMTGPDQVPGPPHLRKVSKEGSGGGVVVRWCAPTSVVTRYIVQVEGGELEFVVDEKRRLVDVGDLKVGAEVCVQAENRAGVSRLEDISCTRFEYHNSESGLAVKLGVIGGVVALIVVLLLALLLWRFRTRRKSATRIESEAVEGVL